MLLQLPTHELHMEPVIPVSQKGLMIISPADLIGTERHTTVPAVDLIVVGTHNVTKLAIIVILVCPGLSHVLHRSLLDLGLSTRRCKHTNSQNNQTIPPHLCD
jgi:hypothetical protein